MRTFEKDDVTFDDLLREIVENQHLFKPFQLADVADAEIPMTRRRTESGNDGAGIVMPEPERE